MNKLETGKSSYQLSDNSVAASPDSDNVKQKCWEQREPLPGEPTCIICGRYGEYICNETDDDVCSLECKSTLLTRLSNSHPSSSSTQQQTRGLRVPTTDICYYIRDQTTKNSELTNNQTDLLRRKLEISVRGNNVLPDPILSFTSCNLDDRLVHNLEAGGYEMPTPVQMQAIPAALAGHSMIVSAKTGSGKTASFLVPIVSHCVKMKSGEPVVAMVLEPTRELCVQVEEQAKLMGKGLPFKTALVVGGEAMAGQVYRIRNGVSMIVGTPGRLIDLLTKHPDIELDSVSILVLDEVDCMMERGFREQVMQIFRALSQPQVLMFSATVSEEVEMVASSMVKDFSVISVGKVNRPNESVKQLAIWVDSKKKKQKLFDILTSKQHFKPPVVVFVGSRIGADLLSEAITATTGLRALSIHGVKPMKERREILRSFLVGEVSVIVATGVLGRGVDLLSVRQVIVFDLPNSMKEYVHQIGRASRMGEDGSAIVFVNEEDKKLFPELVETLKSCGAAIPRELANSRYTVSSFSRGMGQKKRKHG